MEELVEKVSHGIAGLSGYSGAQVGKVLKTRQIQINITFQSNKHGGRGKSRKKEIDNDGSYSFCVHQANNDKLPEKKPKANLHNGTHLAISLLISFLPFQGLIFPSRRTDERGGFHRDALHRNKASFH